MDIKHVAVIGAGEMGHGIAEVFALNGFDVSLVDVNQDNLNKALSSISSSLDRLVSKGTILSEKVRGALSRIKTFTDLANGLKDVEFVVEAVPENRDLKRKVFGQIESNVKDTTVISSNTSNIRITEIASGLIHPERVIGTHFFNPPVIMKPVEIIMGEKTSALVFDATKELVTKIGKTPIRVNKDTPGFIVNRINAADLLFFGLLLDKKVAKPEEVDAFLKAQGMVMGPYELLDFVGIDVVDDSLKYYSTEVSPDYGKVKVYSQMVADGRLGKKTGKGFYAWESGRAKFPDDVKPTNKVSLLDVFAIEINEAVKLIESDVASPDDIEEGVKLGMNRPFGPISVAKGLNASDVSNKLESLAKDFDCSVFEPASSIKTGRMRDIIEHGMAAASRPRENTPVNIIVTKLGDKVSKISINKPRLNLLSVDILDELDTAIDSLWNDGDTNVVLVSGEGDVLSAGADLSTYFANDAQFRSFSKKGQSVFNKLSEMPKITIAVMKGYALGGGLELSLACDLRVATDDVIIGFPEVTHGLIPAWGGTQRLSRLVGASTASRLILTGERITGKDAFSLGMVSKLFTGDIEAGALGYAKEIASDSAPVAAALAKTLVNKSVEMPLDSGLDMESIASGIVFNTDDLKEGLSAFLQKRKPEFKGK